MATRSANNSKPELKLPITATTLGIQEDPGTFSKIDMQVHEPYSSTEYLVYTEVAPTIIGFVLLKAASVSFGRSRCS